MNKDTLIISETPWLAIIISAIIPIGLVGLVIDASWVHINTDSPIVKSVFFIIAASLEVYLLLRGMWPRTIVVDKAKQLITIASNCPYIYSPIKIKISEVKKIRVGDYEPFKVRSGRMFGLFIEKNDGTEIMFGDWNSPEQKKYERWRDEISSFAGIDNITRRSS